MDVAWFKKRQKQVGVTAEDIARRMGRARSSVSNIYNGDQRMSLEWAQAFADVLEVSIDEVLEHAGALPRSTGQALRPGFSDGDVVPFEAAPRARDRTGKLADFLGGSQPGVDVWRVTTPALSLGGYLPGDHILVDTNLSERTASGDVVIAQHYDNQLGAARTLLRRHEPPVLVTASGNPADHGVLFVDGRNVVIAGKVVASWRVPD